MLSVIDESIYKRGVFKRMNPGKKVKAMAYLVILSKSNGKIKGVANPVPTMIYIIQEYRSEENHGFALSVLLRYFVCCCRYTGSCCLAGIGSADGLCITGGGRGRLRGSRIIDYYKKIFRNY